MRRIFLLVGIICLLGMWSAAVRAGPGALDLSFGAGFGYVRYADSTAAVEDQGFGVAVQPDGKVLVAGRSGILPAAVVLRYNTDGTLDDAFADHGVFRWKIETEFATARRIVVLPDGRIYVFGYTDTAAKLWLARLLPDGTPDPAFGTDGNIVATAPGWFGDVRRIVVDLQGLPIVIWESIDPAANKIRISRFTFDGKADKGYVFGDGEIVLDTSAFGAKTNLPFGAVLDPQGRLVVFASSFNAAYNTTLIYRFQNATGYPDAGFGNNGMVALQQKDFAFVGHQWTALAANGTGFVLVEWLPDGVRLQKFNLDGSVATGFGHNGTTRFVFPGGGVTSGNAVVQPDGTIAVTGTRQTPLENEVFLLVATANGELDTRFGTSLPQRTYRGADLGGEPGMTGVDIASTAGLGLAIAGSATGPSGRNDILALQLDGLAQPVSTFGGKGRVTWDGGDVVPESAQGLWAQAGGKLFTLNRTALGWNWRRFLADGRPDTTFGVGGKLALADDWNGPNTQIFTQADKKIVVARQVSGPTFTNLTRVVRYNTDGSRDPHFGSDGALDLIDDAQGVVETTRPGLAQYDDGRLLIATYGTGGLRLRRTTATGEPDVTFGGDKGIVFVPLDGKPQVGYTLAVQDDGKILVGAAKIVVLQAPLPQPTVHSDVIARLMPDGTLDPTFGLQSGVVPIQAEDARDPRIMRILPLPDGKTIVVGNIFKLGMQQFFFLRLNADGTYDTEYGDHTDALDGPGPFVWANVYPTEMRDAVVDAVGRLVITGQFGTAIGRTTAFVVRFPPNGTIDGPFAGIHQHGFLFLRPEATGAGNAIALLPSSIVAAGDSGAMGLIFKLEADGSVLAPSQSVLEFYNTLLNHYFITADLNEAAAIDNGAAGPGWERTGRGFRGWTAAAGVPAIAFPVCRFYGTPGVGPNSHFYTVDLLECDLVRQDPGWRYEGIAFYGVPPQAGRCFDGMQPVLRLYNNRAAQNDSNHRYTTNPTIYEAMQKQGWLPEGVVLCSPVN